MLGEIITHLHVNPSEDILYSSYATATELANVLVRNHDVPFRQAHKIVGALIKYLVEKQITITQITDLTLQNFHNNNPIMKGISIQTNEVRNALDPSTFIIRHNITGGPAPDETKRMLQKRSISLAHSQKWVQDAQHNLSTAMDRLSETIASLLHNRDH
jgi:argininosuccinate lyase